jgi:hypothetical protein
MVAEVADAERTFHSLAEWTTEVTCTEPSTLGGCRLARFPAAGVVDVAWAQLRACDATPTRAAGALIVEPDGEPCPLGGGLDAPPCLLSGGGAANRRAFALACRTLTTEQAVHPDPGTSERAAFRCVVPDGALVGTISR